MTEGGSDNSKNRDFKFPASEKLKSKKKIRELFSEGCSFYSYPFQVIFLMKKSAETQAPKMLFSVPVKNFKKAVKRNLLKRRMREAYRTSKYMLIDRLPAGITIEGLAYIYSEKEILSFDTIKTKLISSFDRLTEKVSET